MVTRSMRGTMSGFGSCAFRQTKSAKANIVASCNGVCYNRYEPQPYNALRIYIEHTMDVVSGRPMRTRYRRRTLLEVVTLVVSIGVSHFNVIVYLEVLLVLYVHFISDSSDIFCLFPPLPRDIVDVVHLDLNLTATRSRPVGCVFRRFLLALPLICRRVRDLLRFAPSPTLRVHQSATC